MVASSCRTLSHIIIILFLRLCFYCEMVMSEPNWLIYFRINWSPAVLLIKTCNHLQGRKEIGGGAGVATAIQMTLLDIWLSGQFTTSEMKVSVFIFLFLL